MSSSGIDLEQLQFDNRFTRDLPADPDSENVPRQVLGACYSRVRPQATAGPRLIASSREVLAELGWDPAIVDDPGFAAVFSGNRLLPGMDAHAMTYGGHQFGHWAGQLGDGRAINLGEVIDLAGGHQMLQLKGAGPTPYSRSADGLAVLRSSVREFLCSEAMHHLGVPTTRALSLVLTGDAVVRDMFYDGRPAAEPGAVVCRVAPSFLRFGSFEILAATGQAELLQQLADFTIRTLYPELGEPGPRTYVAWFEEVCRRTARMIVEWQRVGFVHGVMNTDNMSILGLTIDYGPYGWLESYDPNWTPNTTDATHRRYRFGQQGQIGQWNLAQLANSIVPLVGEVAPLQTALDQYSELFEGGWREMMIGKLGCSKSTSGDAKLIDDLLAVLEAVETDMPIFFRRLADLPLAGGAAPDPAAVKAALADAYYRPEQLTEQQLKRTVEWVRSYAGRVAVDRTGDRERREHMNAVNPKFVPRNYLAQLAIDRAEREGDFQTILDLLDTFRRPYDEQPSRKDWAAKRPEWARNRPGCSTLSCSS